MQESRLEGMTDHICHECDRPGRLGNVNRVYIVTTPETIAEMTLCWPCASARMAKWARRKYYSVVDRQNVA